MLARLRNDEGGQILPALFLVGIATVAGSLMLFQLGRATTMSARAQTGADAAALQAAKLVSDQLLAEYIASEGTSYTPEAVPSPCGLVEGAAQRNGTTVTFCHYNPTTISVRVRVETTGTLDGAYWLPTAGRSARARAHARVIPPPERLFEVRLRNYGFGF